MLFLESACNRNRSREARTLQARACIQNRCVGENRKRPWDWPPMHLKCLRPGAATRYWYAIRHTAEGLTPLQAQSSLDCISPVVSIQGAQTIQGGQQQSNLSRRQILSFAATSPGGRLMGLRSTVQNLGRHVGAWGKICARQTCRCEGQTAAHGQITERKPSVAQFRFLFLFHEGGQLHPTP